MSQGPDILELIKSDLFEAIDLDSLNNNSQLLEREDKKYIVDRYFLDELFLSLRSSYAVLEHVGTRSFRYESIYFDDNLTTYNMHHQGKRKRFKTRSRLYCDSNTCTFEMKLKNYRGNTNKFRIPYDVESRYSIKSEAQEFIINAYKTMYGQDFNWQLEPSLKISHDRITFVAKDGGERVTVDLNIVFENNKVAFIAPYNFAIVETKVKKGIGKCDAVLKSHGYKPQKYCSKYCMGLALVEIVEKKNNFLPILHRIEKLGKGKLLVKEDLENNLEIDQNWTVQNVEKYLYNLRAYENKLESTKN